VPQGHQRVNHGRGVSRTIPEQRSDGIFNECNRWRMPSLSRAVWRLQGASSGRLGKNVRSASSPSADMLGRKLARTFTPKTGPRIR